MLGVPEEDQRDCIVVRGEGENGQSEFEPRFYRTPKPTF